MLEATEPVGETRAPEPPTKPRRRRLLQVGVGDLVLLVICVAVWAGYFANRKHIASLETRIKPMQRLARELVIVDPSKIAVVDKEPLWSGDDRWEINLPKGAYRLCLATREVPEDGFPPAVTSAPLAAGRYPLALIVEEENGKCHLTVTNRGTSLLTVVEPKSWSGSEGSFSTGGYSQSTELDPAQPVTLMRKHFIRGTGQAVVPSQQEPSDGILLWIEPVGGDPASTTR